MTFVVAGLTERSKASKRGEEKITGGGLTDNKKDVVEVRASEESGKKGTVENPDLTWGDEEVEGVKTPEKDD